MNINVKFYMYFNGERIRTLDDLRENFIAEDVLEAYSSGQLAKWLKVWRHKEELEQVEAIESESAREILRELVRIFDPDAEAEEINAELTVYDYLEERRKFREYMMTHGLDKLETLKRERETFKRERDELARERDTLQRERDTFRNELDTLKQENDRLKIELESVQHKQSKFPQVGPWKRIDIPAGSITFSTWTTLIPSSTACRIIDVGNCQRKLLVMIQDTYKAIRSNLPIEEVCYNAMILQGISVYLWPTKAEDLYFYYEEV